MYVYDATPLIYLARSDALDLVDAIDEPAVTPKRVYEEVVVDGVEAGYADARRIERTIDDGAFEVRSGETEAFERLRTNENLSEADAAVLGLAAARDATAVMDETYGRRVADAEGVETRGTAFVVLRALQSGAIDADEAIATIDAMVAEGWYCSTAVYARIRDRIEELS